MRGQVAVCIASVAAPRSRILFLHSNHNLVHTLKQIPTLASRSHMDSCWLRFDGCRRACYIVVHNNQKAAGGA